MLTRAWGIARSLVMYHGQPGRHRRVVRFYRQFLGPGDIGFDVGAHVGSRVRAWRRLGAQVVAIEPQPDFVRVLRLFFGRDRGVTIAPGRGRRPARYGPAGAVLRHPDGLLDVAGLDRVGHRRPQLRRACAGTAPSRSR